MRFLHHVILLLLLIPLASYADDQPSEANEFQLEEITVTTRKREEILQKIPVAITTFSAQQIEDANIQNIEDISLLTPGFTYGRIFDGKLGNPVIRGANTLIGEPNVGFFLDGVYQESREVMNAMLGDSIERIEVAKGPQNALYGRNTFSGAVNYISKRPENEPYGRLKLTLGNYGRQDASLFHNGALINDTLFYRLSAAHSGFDGFYDNELTGGDLDDRQSNLYALALTALPTDNLEMTFRIAVENTNDGDQALQFIDNNAGFSTDPLAPPAPFIFNDNQIYSGELPSLDNGFAVTSGYNNRDNVTSSFHVVLDLESVTLTSITAYNDLSRDAAYDSDYQAQAISTAVEELEQDEFSQEFRLSSIDQPIRWMAGIYLYKLDKENKNRNEFVLGAALGPLATILSPNLSSKSDNSTKNVALFGSLGFDLSQKLSLSLSGRYAYEKKEVNVTDTDLISLSSTTFQDSKTFNHFTPQAALSYQFSDSALVYGSLAKAVKSGGFNSATFGGRVPASDERSFDEETSMNYEIGLKTAWFENRLTANLALFLIKWEDQIVRTLGANQAVLNDNAGKSTSQGFEFELAAKPARNWDINAGLTYTDAQYDDYTFDALSIVGLDPILDGNQIQYVSEWTANASVQYTRPFALAHLDWKSRMDVMYQAEQRSSFIDGAPIIPDRTIVNFRTTLENQQYALTLWLKNVFDDDGSRGSSSLPNPEEAASYLSSSAGYQQFQALTQAPIERTFGITASVKF